MKKITDLTEEKWRTVHFKDALGNRRKDREYYNARRKVKTVPHGPRVAHFIIDLIAFKVVVYVVIYLLGLLSASSVSTSALSLTSRLMGTLTLLLLYPAMYAFCEYTWQRTPGKFLTKTLVIDEYGNKPDLRRVVLRSLIRLVPLDGISCLSDEGRGWHDKWSDTFVVTDAELAALRQMLAEQSPETVTEP